MITLMAITAQLILAGFTGRAWLRWYMSTTVCGSKAHRDNCVGGTACGVERGEVLNREPVNSWYAFLAGMFWPITLCCLFISRARPTNGELHARAAKLERQLEASQRELDRLNRG